MVFTLYSYDSVLMRFFFQTIGAFLLVMGFGGWVAWFGLRGTEPARAEEALGRMGLSRCARGGGWFASKARSGPVPLPPRGWIVGGGFAGPSLRALRRLAEFAPKLRIHIDHKRTVGLGQKHTTKIGRCSLLVFM